MRRARAALLCTLGALSMAGAAHAAPALVRTLDNGLQVAVFSDHRLPIVQIQVLVPAGSASEQPLEAGAATVTAALLTRGTASRSATQFEHDVEAIGGSVLGDAARDYATVSGAFRSTDLERGLELVADAVIDPIFDDGELDAARRELARRVIQSRTRPDVVADEHVWAVAMKDHPYAAPPDGTVDGIIGLSRARVTAFHRAQYRPDHALVTVAGDVDPEQAMTAVEEAFGSWAGHARSAAAPPVAKPPGLRIRIVDAPGSPEAEIRVAIPVPPRGSDESMALAVANDLLGGGVGSRLGGDAGRVLKAYSQLQQQREAGLLILGTSARNDSVAAAVDRLRNELARFASSPPTAPEVERARRVLGRSYPLRNETLGAQEAQWLTGAFLGLGNDYPDHFSERVEAVTPDQVRDVARRYFDPERATIVVVGAADALKSTLEKRAAVEVVSIQDPPAPVAIAPAFRMDPPDEASARQGRKVALEAVAVHGGLTKLKSIKDSQVEAEITLYHSGQSVVGKQTELRREPGQLRSQTEFMQLETVQALHGDTAWTQVKAGSQRDSTMAEGPEGVAAMKRTFGGDLPHLLRTAADPRSRVAYRGQDDVGAGRADVIEVVSADSVRWVLFIDPQTHRLVGAEDNQGSPLRGVALRRMFGEQRLVQGVLWPFAEERQVDGERTLTLKVSRVQFNLGIDPVMFESLVPTKPTHRRR